MLTPVCGYSVHFFKRKTHSALFQAVGAVPVALTSGYKCWVHESRGERKCVKVVRMANGSQLSQVFARALSHETAAAGSAIRRR